MKMSYKEKHSLPKSEFAIPAKEKYPINDLAHARNALARVSTFGSSKEKSMVRKKVHSAWPSIAMKKK
jgi:hypothetical protein